jgi:transcription antitermination factor NusG
MTLPHQKLILSKRQFLLPSHFIEKMYQPRNANTKWYLIYTNPRSEKKVEAELLKRGYEVFLPMHKTLKQWSDRKKWVEEPLFKSYIFINTELEKKYYDIKNVSGIVKFVIFEKNPAEVDPREIALVKLMLGDLGVGSALLATALAQTWEIGEEVEVIAGPLIGTKGKLIYKNGNKFLQIELETMQQTLLVRIPPEFVRVRNDNTRINTCLNH